jgi:hypothetical protein
LTVVKVHDRSIELAGDHRTRPNPRVRQIVLRRAADLGAELEGCVPASMPVVEKRSGEGDEIGPFSLDDHVRLGRHRMASTISMLAPESANVPKCTNASLPQSAPRRSTGT